MWGVPGNAEERGRGGILKLYTLLPSSYVRQDVAEEMYLKSHKGMAKVCDGFLVLWDCSPPLDSTSSFGSLAPDMVHRGCNNGLLCLVQDLVVSQYRKWQRLN